MKFFTGWIRAIDDNRLTVELRKEAALHVQEKFNMEAGLHLATVSLLCELVFCKGTHLKFQAVGAPKVCSNQQEARYRADSVLVAIKGLEEPVVAETADVSNTGIGVWTATQLPRSASLQLVVSNQIDTIECVGTVRYSRSDPDKGGQFRSGIQVEFADRLSKAMWLRMVQAAQAGYKAA